MTPANRPVTPDERYIVVRGRLWRRANPNLPAAKRQRLVQELMSARRQVRLAGEERDHAIAREARARVQATKIALGERGPVWWNDGAPDYNRRLARKTPYAAWYAQLGHSSSFE